MGYLNGFSTRQLNFCNQTIAKFRENYMRLVNENGCSLYIDLNELICQWKIF